MDQADVADNNELPARGEGASFDDREGRILERVLTLKQMLKERRGGPLELHELAICYHALENYRQAADYLRDLRFKFPDYLQVASATSLQILCLIEAGAFDDAAELLAERLDLYPDDTILLALQAHIHERRNEPRRAIDLHRRILELAPDNANSLNSLGYLLTLHSRGPGDDAEALRSLRKVLKARPGNPAYLDSLGVYLARKGQSDAARKALMQALKLAPQNGVILQHLKEVLQVRGDEKKGKSDTDAKPGRS